MKIKTSEATELQINYLVAKCEGLPLKLDPMGFRKDAPNSVQAGWWVWDGEGQNQIIGHRKTRRGDDDGYSPSNDWAQAGPIIERERICLRDTGDDNDLMWEADDQRDKDGKFRGPTPLIAAMRCYVASVLGDEVEIPEELT